jgi:hypothetical protein
MRPLYDPPPRPDPGVLLQRFGCFPPRSEVCGESTCGAQVADLVISIACVQAQPLGRSRGRCRPLDGNTLNRLPHPLEVMPLSPRHREADGHAALGADAARDPELPPIGRLLADLVPPPWGAWVMAPSLASPSPSSPCKVSEATRPLCHRARQTPAAVHSWKRRGAARRESMSVSGRACHWQLAASAAPEEQCASSRRVGLFISVAK